jgi:hypothetical protein
VAVNADAIGGAVPVCAAQRRYYYNYYCSPRSLYRFAQRPRVQTQLSLSLAAESLLNRVAQRRNNYPPGSRRAESAKAVRSLFVSLEDENSVFAAILGYLGVGLSQGCPN